MTIKVDGLSQLEQRIQELPQRMDTALESAAMRAALLVQGRAMERTPVATSNLRRSEASSTERDGNRIMGIVGTNVIYAVFVHEGTRFMKARPFFTDALNESGDDVLAIFEDAVAKAVAGGLPSRQGRAGNATRNAAQHG